LTFTHLLDVWLTYSEDDQHLKATIAFLESRILDKTEENEGLARKLKEAQIKVQLAEKVARQRGQELLGQRVVIEDKQDELTFAFGEIHHLSEKEEALKKNIDMMTFELDSKKTMDTVYYDEITEKDVAMEAAFEQIEKLKEERDAIFEDMQHMHISIERMRAELNNREALRVNNENALKQIIEAVS